MCSPEAEQRFSVERMVTDHVQLYETQVAEPPNAGRGAGQVGLLAPITQPVRLSDASTWAVVNRAFDLFLQAVQGVRLRPSGR